MKLSGKHKLLFVFLFVIVCLSPLMALRDFTPANELRYLNIVDEAIENGNVFAFTNQGRPYADKPPLYFWLMMLCRLVFGTHSMYALSLLSLVPALGTVWIMDRWLRAELGERWGGGESVAYALMLATTGLFLGVSVFLRMDMLMCFFIVLALFTFYRMYTGKGDYRKLSWLFPVYIFLALFTKGPVGLLVPPLSVVVFLAAEGRIKECGRYLGWKTWSVLAGLSVLWFLGVLLDGGTAYLNNLLFHQTIDRAVNAFHHKEPFWFYFMSVWYVVMPYALLLVPVFVAGLFGKTRKGTAEKLFLCVIATTLLMLSVFSSKLTIYMLPVFPFLVYLLPLYLRRQPWNRWMGAALALPAAVVALAGLAGAGVSWLKGLSGALDGLVRMYPFIESVPVVAGCLVLAAGGAFALRYLFTENYRMAWSGMAVSLLVAVLSCSFAIPQLNDWLGYRNICGEVMELEEDGRETVATLCVNRPENMDVYLGHDILDFGYDTERFLKEMPDDCILVATTHRVKENKSLEERLEGLKVAERGPYSVYRIKGK